jgi:hypothetical protein
MRYYWVFIVGFLIISCESESSIVETDLNNGNERLAIYSEGKRLMENKCYVCHNPNVKEAHLIAPALVDIKALYYMDKEEDFITSFISFIDNPDKTKAKLPEAVEKYGLMPYQRYDKESLRKIALYIYNNQIQEPEWWEGTQKGNVETANIEENEKSYAEIGLHFALSTKQVLGANLMGTIQRKGTLEAVKFCHITAYPLTDSMAQVHNASIKRISDQPRNPKNAASKEDLPFIEKYKKIISEGKEPESTVIERENDVLFYHPIITNEKCLLCHGKKEDIAVDVLTALQNSYPNDQATGYNANDVRGLWKITFNK